MADSYLSIAAIAKDEHMVERMNSAVTQQVQLGNAPIIAQDPVNRGPYAATAWVEANRYVWASSPGWGEAWKYALDSHSEDPDYKPGADESVITDGMILTAVQTLGNPLAAEA